MNALSRFAIRAYLATTWQYRRRLVQALEKEGRAPVLVLFYHRVADQTLTPWTLSNSEFQRQMRWLQAHTDLVSLTEAQRRLREGNDRLAVSITFDDGYADNCDEAIPFLIRQRIPCTYFVSLDFVENGYPFPHDEQLGTPLAPNTLEQLRQMAEAGVEIGGHTRGHVDVGKLAEQAILEDEVLGSCRDLAAVIGQPVRFFAFPFGQLKNLNLEAAKLAQAHGLHGIVSAFGGYNLPRQPAFYLRRVPGDAEFVRMQNWLTIDPRWLRAKYSDDEFLQLAPLAEMVTT